MAEGQGEVIGKLIFEIDGDLGPLQGKVQQAQSMAGNGVGGGSQGRTATPGVSSAATLGLASGAVAGAAATVATRSWSMSESVRYARATTSSLAEGQAVVNSEAAAMLRAETPEEGDAAVARLRAAREAKKAADNLPPGPEQARARMEAGNMRVAAAEAAAAREREDASRLAGGGEPDSFKLKLIGAAAASVVAATNESMKIAQETAGGRTIEAAIADRIPGMGKVVNFFGGMRRATSNLATEIDILNPLAVQQARAAGISRNQDLAAAIAIQAQYYREQEAISDQVSQGLQPKVIASRRATSQLVALENLRGLRQDILINRGQVSVGNPFSRAQSFGVTNQGSRELAALSRIDKNIATIRMNGGGSSTLD